MNSSEKKTKKNMRIESLEIDSRRQVSMVCSFALDNKMHVDVDRALRWSDEGRKLLLLVASELAKKKVGNAPTRPLRDTLRNACKDGIYVCEKLFKFNETVCYFEVGRFSAPELLQIVRFWVASTLVPFCREQEIDEGLLTELTALVDNESLAEIVVLSAENRPNEFVMTRALAFAKIEQVLIGQTVFPGRGPLMVECSAEDDDELTFVTTPSYFSEGKSPIFGSLVLRFAVAKVPGSNDKLVVNVTGGRREWDLRPEETEYRTNAYFFLPEEGRVHRVHFPSKKHHLNLAWDLPVYMDSYNSLETVIRRSDIGKVFGNSASLYKLRKGAGRRMGRGLPPLDLATGIQGIRPLLASVGINQLLPDEKRPSVKNRLGFDSENRMSFSSEKNLKIFLEYVAESWTPEQLDLFNNANDAGVIEKLMGYVGPIEQKKEPKEITVGALKKWKATAERFIVPGRKLGIIARSEDDREMIDGLSKHFTWNLFSNAKIYYLPKDVHGILPPEKGSKVSETDRHMLLRRNWAGTINQMKKDRVTDVLALVPKQYDGKDEDPINKATAKYVFAEAGLNSQYLTPRTAQEIADNDGGNGFLQRSLSAIRDLCFGNRGVVVTPPDLHQQVVANGFDARYVYGISIAQHNKTSNNRRSASVLIVTRLDLATGLIDASLFDGVTAKVEWMPFYKALQTVAKTTSQDILGKTKKRQDCQVCMALRKILDNISEIDPNAIVLVDSRSGGLHQKWKWLQAGNLRKRVFLDNEENSSEKWQSLNFVLLDVEDAAHILNGGSARDGFYTTSSAVATVQEDSELGVYWYQAEPRDTTKLPKISCSVPSSDGNPPISARTDYMVPRPIQIVIKAGVLTKQRSAFLLSLLIALRKTHLTYADESRFPSPLFQHARLKSDMCRLMPGLDGKLEFIMEYDGEVE